MYCTQCGKELPDSSKFCPNCGAPLSETSAPASTPGVATSPTNSKRFSLLYPKSVFIGIAVLAIAVIFVVILLNMKSPPYITIVQEGHLGEYTDITVQEMLDGHYGLLYDTITWDGGETDSGESIVEVKYHDTSEVLDDVTIQFTMLDNNRFKVSAFVDPRLNVKTTSDLDYVLNQFYLEQYILSHYSDNSDEFMYDLAFIERMDQISRSSVLYGAAKNYAQDRSQLCTVAGDVESECSVAELFSLKELFIMDELFGSTAESFLPTEGDVIDTELYTITVPAEWTDLYYTEQWENGMGYGLAFYERQSYDDNCGGKLFSIVLEVSDYDYPNCKCLGTLDVVRLASFDVVVLYPTDIQFSDAGMERYNKMSNDIGEILGTFSAKEEVGASFYPQ